MNCTKNHGSMIRGQGFYVCLVCSELVFDQPHKASVSVLSVLDTLPFPIAFPLAHALDRTLCPAPLLRFDNMIFAASQMLRLTSLLLLSDYFEIEATCSKLDTHIRALRMPHWENWSSLARGLSKFWKSFEAQKPERPSRFGWLTDAWLEVACTRIGDSRWKDALRNIPGNSGHAVSLNEAFQKARNDHHHRLTTRVPSHESATACENALQKLLPLLAEACELLFPKDKILLLRKLPADPTRCIHLLGPHRNKQFIPVPVPEFSDPAFAKSEVVAWCGSSFVPLHPLIVPIDDSIETGEVVVLEPATFLDQAKENEVVLLGVEKWWVRRDYAQPFNEAIRRKQVGLGLSRDETKMWTLATWSSENARANLEELIGKKYFPDCYVERKGVDDLFNLCIQAEGRGLLLLGEAGSGKSSLLCRLVEKLTRPESQEPEADEKQERNKPASLDDYLRFRGPNHAVIFLSGRAAFGGDSHLQGSALLCGAVLQKAGIAPGAFETLEKLAAALEASASVDTVSRKVWLILDALNEADRFEDLLAALDKFLPNLPRFPWLKLIVSIRSGAYHTLNRRHSDLARTGASFLENEHHFFSFEDKGSNKVVPYLEATPFTMEEGALAHELRQKSFPEKSVSISWKELGETIRELLLNPLHLHLFHETFGIGRVLPEELDADALLNAYLNHLCAQNAGLERTLERIGELMFYERIPSLPVAKADEWLNEWRSSGSVAGGSAKLNPIEELVSASLLMRPAEHGVGAARSLRAYQFRHQKLCEQVLLRELRRQIHPRNLPTGEELTDWVARISASNEDNNEPFKELLGALQSIVKNLFLAGAAVVVAALFPVKAEAIRAQLILGGLLRSRLDLHGAELELFLRNLVEHADRSSSLGENIVDAVYVPLAYLEVRGGASLARRFWEVVVEIGWSLAAKDPESADRQQSLALSLFCLGSLVEDEGDYQHARGLFETALSINRGLVAAAPESADRQRDVAELLNCLGGLVMVGGDTRTARALFEEALSIDRALVAAEPQRTNRRRDLCASLTRLGDLMIAEGDGQHARSLFEEVLDINRVLMAAEPHSEDRKGDLSLSLNRLGDLLKAEGDSQRARQLFEEALSINRALLAADPRNTDRKWDLSVSLNHLGNLAEMEGEFRRARELFEEALSINRALVAAEPQRTRPRMEISVSLNGLGVLAEAEGDTKRARSLFKEALSINRALVALEPENSDRKRDLAVSLGQLGRLAETEGDSGSARELFEEALSINRALVAAEPHRADRLRDLSVLLTCLGGLMMVGKNTRTARALFEEVLSIDRALLAGAPQSIDRKRDLSRSLNRLGYLSEKEGDTLNARGLFEESLEINRALVEAEPQRTDLKADLCASLNCLGCVVETEGDTGSARELFEEALSINRALVAAEPQRSDRKGSLSASLKRLAAIAKTQGDGRKALALFREALDIEVKLLEAEPQSADLKRTLFLLLTRLGDLAKAEGDRLNARTFFEEALRINRELAATEPQNPDQKRNLFLSLTRLGDLAEAEGNTRNARELFEEALEVKRTLLALEPQGAARKRGIFE